WPDVTKLETDIRGQLASLENALTAAVKDSATTEATLSEAYGTMGEVYHAYSLLAPARECYLNASGLASKDFRWVYLLGRLDQRKAESTTPFVAIKSRASCALTMWLSRLTLVTS